LGAFTTWDDEGSYGTPLAKSPSNAIAVEEESGKRLELEERCLQLEEKARLITRPLL